MKYGDDTHRMMRLRDKVDRLFLDYAERQMSVNIESLSHLALIGGRLDTLLRRKIAAERKRSSGSE